MKKTFSSFTIIGEAWDLFVIHKQFFLKNTLVFGLISVVANSMAVQHSTKVIDVVLHIVSSISSWYAMVVLIKGSLWITSGKILTEDVYNFTVGSVISLIVGSLLVALGTVIGIVFFFIPGIVFFIRSYLTHYVILDTDLGAYASLKRGLGLTQGYFWSIARLTGCFMVLAILSVFPLFGLGFILLFPVMILANTRVYRILSTNQNQIPQPLV